MQNHIVNVLISTKKQIQEVMPGGGLIHLQFGPCTKSEGEELVDEINRWGRGGEARGVIGLQQLILRMQRPIVDVWASCDEIRSPTTVSELLLRFQHERV